jgi:hypothetical protein
MLVVDPVFSPLSLSGPDDSDAGTWPTEEHILQTPHYYGRCRDEILCDGWRMFFHHSSRVTYLFANKPSCWS